MAKKAKMVSIALPKHLVGEIKDIVRMRLKDEQPAKPIKRTMNVSARELKQWSAKFKGWSTFGRRVTNEIDRLVNLTDRKLTKADMKWVDQQLQVLLSFADRYNVDI